MSSPAPQAIAPRPSSVRAGPAARHRANRLAVTWIQGSFRAGILRRHLLIAEWISPAPVPDFVALEDAIRQACEALGFDGQEATLIVERESFSHQMEALPPAAPHVQRAYLRNRVRRDAGDAVPAYGFQLTYSTKNEQNAILHILPRDAFDGIVAAFEHNRIRLVRLFPLFALLPLQAQRLDLEREEIVVIAAETAGVTSLVAGGRDGRLLFGRTILNNWRRDAARTATEINRSILFARQRFGITIDTVFLVGEQSAAAAESLKPQLDRSILVKPHECSPAELMDFALRLSIKEPSNLLAASLRQRRQRKFARFAFAAGLWGCLALAAQNAWRSESNLRVQRQYIEGLQRNREQQEATLAVLARRDELAAHAAAVVEEVLDGQLPPVAANFARWIPSRIPEFMRLKRMEVSWHDEDQSWGFRIEGVSKGDIDATLAALDDLEAGLAGAPFRARITSSNKVALGSFLSRRANRPTRDFFVEGRLFE